MRVATLCLIAASLTGTAIAEEQDELTPENKEFITESVNLLGDCSGFFEAMSDIFKSDNKPASSEQLHQMANGAMMAASYLLYLEYYAAAEKRERKPIGAFSHYAQGRADTNKTRVAAMLEQRNTAGIQAEQKRCLDAVPLQKDLVQRMRDESVGRQ